MLNENPRSISMKDRYILLICAVMLFPFLSGCEEILQPSGKSIGRTYAQLVEAKRSDQILHVTSMGMKNGTTYYCNPCNGSPSRTYTNRAGDKVAVYFYTSEVNDYRPPYSACVMLEEHYDLRDGAVVAEWKFGDESERYPLYTRNVCDGYTAIYGKGLRKQTYTKSMLTS